MCRYCECVYLLGQMFVFGDVRCDGCASVVVVTAVL